MKQIYFFLFLILGFSFITYADTPFTNPPNPLYTDSNSNSSEQPSLEEADNSDEEADPSNDPDPERGIDADISASPAQGT